MKKAISDKIGFKSSPLGPIPMDWEIKQLGELTSLLTNGFVGKATDHYVEAEDGVTYVQGYNVTETGFNYKGIKKVSRIFHEKNKKSCLQKDDLLTIQTGDVGVTTIVPQSLEGSNCHALVISRFVKEVASPNFYHQYFNSIIGRRYFKTIETGSTMKHLNVGDMEFLKIPYPPLLEQNNIAVLLGTWDKAIEKITQLITAQEQRKKWLMQQLLTGKKRLKGFTADWSEFELGDLIEEYSEQTDSDKEYEVFTSSKLGLMKQKDYYTEGRVSERDSTGFNIIPPNYLTYRSRSETGLFTFNQNNFGITGIVSVYYPVFKAINGDSKFLITFCNFNKRHFRKHSVGTSQLVLSLSDFKKVKFRMPNIKEQTAIGRILQTADKEIDLLKQKLAACKEQKKGLMQVLLTGKVRLKLK